MTYQQAEAKVMDQVRHLLSLAQDPGATDAEKELAFNRANKLMARHAIDQAMLDAQRTTGEKRVPTSTRFKIWEEGFDWKEQFRTILGEIARTNRCRVALHHGSCEATLVGMREDVEWTQMLWMQVFLDFVSQIEPRWKDDALLPDNIFAFKHAGYKWEDVWETAKRNLTRLGSDTPDKAFFYEPAKARWMMRMYKSECTRREVTPIGTQTHQVYRQTFTNAYRMRICERLEEMRAQNTESEGAVAGSAVALRDVSERVDETFYELFPTLHPDSLRNWEEQMLKMKSEREEQDQAFLASLSPEARAQVLKDREEAARQRAKEDDAYWRKEAKRKTFDLAGYAAGQEAANRTDLSRKSGAVDQHIKTALES